MWTFPFQHTLAHSMRNYTYLCMYICLSARQRRVQVHPDLLTTGPWDGQWAALSEAHTGPHVPRVPRLIKIQVPLTANRVA